MFLFGFRVLKSHYCNKDCRRLSSEIAHPPFAEGNATPVLQLIIYKTHGKRFVKNTRVPSFRRDFNI